MRKSQLLLLLLLLPAAVLSLMSVTSLAQTGPTEPEAQIRAIVQSEADAWNRGDAEAFAAHYAENGSFTNVIGMQLYGRKGFIAQHARIFSTIYKGSHNTLTVTRIALLRSDVAIVDIDSALAGARSFPPGLKPDADGTLHTKLQEVMTRENGTWQIAAFHNVAVYPLPPTTEAPK